MTNEEIIDALEHIVGTERVSRNLSDRQINAIYRAITAVVTVNRIKQAIDKQSFPEYLEEEVIDIINDYYREAENEQ